MRWDNWQAAEQYFPMGRTNYLGVCGMGKGTMVSWKGFDGIFANRATWALSQVNDGTSNVLMYGETCGRYDPDFGLGDNAWDKPWFGLSALTTFFGLQEGQQARGLSFSSNHGGMVQFCFADGSVHALRVGTTAEFGSPDWYLLQELGGVSDGRAVQANQLVAY